MPTTVEGVAYSGSDGVRERFMPRVTMNVIQETDSGVLLRVRVQPRARAERLDGVHGGQLRIRLTAPPVGGAANAACLAFLAKCLGARRAQLRIQAGTKSRDKLVHISGLSSTEVASALGMFRS